jgi:hypothetical protein
LLASITGGAINSSAAPVQFNQVLQIINAKPGRANTSSFVGLRLADDNLIVSSDDDDGKKKAAPLPQDGRVITETRAEIVENDVCDCDVPFVAKNRFPYAWLALGAVPFLFLIPRGKDKPTSTPTLPVTPTPPFYTPMPPTEPIPEPMTILLFGTGLASVGLAARRKFGKKDEDETEE